MRRVWLTGFSIVAAALALAAAAAADWLVTKDGLRIATKGAWRRQGAVVVFTLPNGTLSSLKAAEIDFDASARETAAATAPKPVKEPKKKPVLVLRDEDVAHVVPSVEAPPAPGQPAAPAKGDTAGTSQVGVSKWHQENNDEGLVVSGTVRNNDAKTAAADVAVNVRVFDPDGKLLVSGPASLSATTLPPGGAATFTVTFPVSQKPASLKFDVSSSSAPAAPPPGP